MRSGHPAGTQRLGCQDPPGVHLDSAMPIEAQRRSASRGSNQPVAAYTLRVASRSRRTWIAGSLARVPGARIKKRERETCQLYLAGKPGTGREGSCDAASSFPEPRVGNDLHQPPAPAPRADALPRPGTPRRPRWPRGDTASPERATWSAPPPRGVHSPIRSTCGAVCGRTEPRK